MFFTRDRSFYRRFFLLTATIAFQNVITFSVAVADNMMVGRLGETALSAVYASIQPQGFIHMMVIGIGAAMGILVAQYWGRRDIARVHAVASIGLKTAFFVGVALTLGCTLRPDVVLRLFTDDAAIVEAGRPYFVVLSISYVFFCVSQVLIAAHRSVGTARIGLYASAVTLGVNVFLNWVLIFGNLGAPALGLFGAALATLTARVTECGVMIAYTRFRDRKLRFPFSALRGRHPELVRDFRKYGTPVIVGDLLWGLNLSVQGAIIGRLGATAMASVSVAGTLTGLFSVAVFGAASASAVIVGHTVGAEAHDHLRPYVRTLQVIFLGIGLATGLAVFGIRDWVTTFYVLSPEAVAMTRRFMAVLAISVAGTAYQMSVLTGIVRAGGSTHFVLVNDLIFVWLVVNPSALLSAFVFHCPPWVVFACLRCDQVLKCLVAAIKVNRYDWCRKLTRTELSTSD